MQLNLLVWKFCSVTTRWQENCICEKLENVETCKGLLPNEGMLMTSFVNWPEWLFCFFVLIILNTLLLSPNLYLSPCLCSVGEDSGVESKQELHLRVSSSWSHEYGSLYLFQHWGLWLYGPLPWGALLPLHTRWHLQGPPLQGICHGHRYIWLPGKFSSLEAVVVDIVRRCKCLMWGKGMLWCCHEFPP